jgi:predicted nucleotidyltransferase
MNVKELQISDRLVYEVVAGSHAYGLSTPKSDKDLRGIYINPTEEYLGLQEPSKQIGDDKHDIVYYSLKRFFELAQTANPNILELLWMPDDCIKILNDPIQHLLDHRNMFISKKAFFTHAKYAESQIKKARGQNKKVHNPQPKEQPKKEDFCWFINKDDLKGEGLPDIDVTDWSKVCFPMRPKPLKESTLSYAKEPPNLNECHVSSVEHLPHAYRLYHYGDKAKGVFRGDDMLVCESIPKEDENDKFEGLLIYNKDEYEKALKDHKSYWDWMKNRNEARWVDQEKGLVNYDAKNLMHCMRLLMSGESILKRGFPIVRFEGKDREYLMSIRSGEMEYDNIMDEVDRRMSQLEDLYKTSDVIPHSVNVKKIDQLYKELRGC